MLLIQGTESAVREYVSENIIEGYTETQTRDIFIPVIRKPFGTMLVTVENVDGVEIWGATRDIDAHSANGRYLLTVEEWKIRTALWIADIPDEEDW